MNEVTDKINVTGKQMGRVGIRSSVLLLTFIFIIGLVVVAYRGDKSDERINKIVITQARVITQVQSNTNTLEKNFRTQCEDRNKAAEGTNEILSTLITAVSATKSIELPERERRILLYKSVKVPILVC